MSIASLTATRLAASKRDEAFTDLFTQAHVAGVNAVHAAAPPAPMVVQVRENPLDDSSPVVKSYPPVMDGVCGFAWVVIRPGGSSFARWLVKNGMAQTAYGGGVQIWVRHFNQSLTKKLSYAVAFAEVLRNAGFNAYSDSRID